jgi:hypothetical protein
MHLLLRRTAFHLLAACIAFTLGLHPRTRVIVLLAPIGDTSAHGPTPGDQHIKALRVCSWLELDIYVLNHIYS